MKINTRAITILFLLFPFLINAQAIFNTVDSIPVSGGVVNLPNAWAGGINFPSINELDLNGDGVLDMFVFDKHNNRITTYLNNGSTNPSAAWNYAPQYISQFPPINKWSLCYDYNNDGKIDLFTLTSNPPAGIAVYRNDYSVTNGLQWTLINPYLQERFFTITQPIYASGVSLPAFTDIDNDGDMDILGYNTLPDGRIAYHINKSMENYGIPDSLDFSFETACWGNFTLLIGGANSVGCFRCPCRMARPLTEEEQANNNEVIPYEQPNYNAEDAARRDDTISGIFPIDLDGDGDKELLVGDIASTNTLMIHNAGTPSAADMDTQDINFPSYDTPADFNGFHYHSYLDLDNDGQKDLVAYPAEFENRKGLWYYKNTATTNSPMFNFQTKSFLQDQMIDVGDNACPALFDYDADGLIDLFVGGATWDATSNSLKTSLTLYKNTGTSINPAFTFITSDFGGLSSLNLSQFLYPAFADIDGDGDKDLFIGKDDGAIIYLNNFAGAGNIANFQLASATYMNIDIGNYATPAFYDIDRDGALDMIIGEKNGFLNYYHNNDSATSAMFNSVPDNDTLGCIVVQAPATTDGYTSPFFYDSVGVTKLIVGSELTGLYQYNQIDGNLSSCFNREGTLFPEGDANRIKFNVAVSGGDLNGDGFIDLVVGHSTGGLQVMLQRDPLLSIPEVSFTKASFEVFPNPAADQFYIKFFHAQNAIVNIFSLTGQQMMSSTLQSNELNVNTSNWSKGVYMIQLVSEQNVVSRKVVIH